MAFPGGLRQEMVDLPMLRFVMTWVDSMVSGWDDTGTEIFQGTKTPFTTLILLADIRDGDAGLSPCASCSLKLAFLQLSIGFRKLGQNLYSYHFLLLGNLHFYQRPR